MSWEDPYFYVDAFLEPSDQIDWTGDGVLCQMVTVMMTDDTDDRDPAICGLSAQDARDLAFRLLSLAENAERLTRHRQEDQR